MKFTIEDYSISESEIEVSLYERETGETSSILVDRKAFWKWVEDEDYNAYYDLPDPRMRKYNDRMDPRDPEYYTVDGAYCEEDFFQLHPEFDNALENYINKKQ